MFSTSFENRIVLPPDEAGYDHPPVFRGALGADMGVWGLAAGRAFVRPVIDNSPDAGDAAAWAPVRPLAVGTRGAIGGRAWP